jgi:hypothetical protein
VQELGLCRSELGKRSPGIVCLQELELRLKATMCGVLREYARQGQVGFRPQGPNDVQPRDGTSPRTVLLHPRLPSSALL